MNFGIFVGLSFIGNLLLVLVGLIVIMVALWLIFATPLGLFIIAALIIFGLIKLFK